MALFTDGALNTLAELQAYENGIFSVATAEDIDVTAKSVIAREQLGTDLLLFLRRNCLRRRDWLAPGVGLDNIVVSGPLKQWHAYKTLSLIYQDAYNNQLNDRYQGKWTEYKQLSSEASEALFEVGVGIVFKPVPKASVPVLNAFLRSSSGTSCYLGATWVSNSGQEGLLSDLVQAGTADGATMEASAGDPPKGVTAWNVYAGAAPDSVKLQNNAPMALDSAWTGSATALSSGRTPGLGQAPELWIVERRTIQRG